MKSRAIKAILLDADGVILHDEISRYNRLEAFLEKLELGRNSIREIINRAAVSEVERFTKETWIRTYEQEDTLVIDFARYIQSALLSYGVHLDDDLFKRLHHLCIDPNFYAIYPEVESVLASLKRNQYVLAVLSNALPSLKPALCRLGIAEHFNFIITSADLGVAKPDPAIYVEAIRAVGVLPEQVLFIDDRESNVTAACRQGIRGIRLDRRTTSLTDLTAELL